VPEAPREVLIAFDPEKKEVLIGSGKPLKGAHYELLDVLRPSYEEARRAGLLPQRYPTLAAPKLADALGITEPSLRKQLDRLRREVRERGIDPDVVIENVPWHGYRLSPSLRLVAPSTLLQGEVTSFRKRRHNSSPLAKGVPRT
jgi:biotin operon repressor